MFVCYLRTILLKRLEPYLSFMEEFKQGLDVYDLLRHIRNSPDIFRLMFCRSDILLWSYENFAESLDVQWSENGSSKKQVELACFRGFLEMCEMAYHDGTNNLIILYIIIIIY